MAKGGTRPGAGRPKGSIARHRKLANEATLKAVGDGETPLEFLLSIMRNGALELEARKDAAKAAIAYVHPRLASIEHKGDDDNPIAFAILSAVPRGMDDEDELAANGYGDH
jgi:hypothetical protein